MDLTFSHYLQLSIALFLGIVFFISLYTLPQKITITALILLIPFQFITSGLGSLNMVLTYIVGIALIINKKMDFFPLLKASLFIILTYLLTISQVDLASYPRHIVYLISLISNFLLFYIIYNYIVKSGNYRYFFNVLVILNILCIIYVIFQATLGFESHAFLGIKEFTIQGSKEMFVYGTEMIERRLRGGPFEAPGINSEYMAIQIFILGYLFINERHRYKKNLLIGLIITNFMVIIGTGNRGGLFTFIAGCIIFYYLFRQEIGIKRIFGSIFIFGFLFTIAFIFIINYTPYDSIFQRIKKTEIRKGVPDTREKVWEISYDAFKQKPILGWGPRIDIIPIPEFREKNSGKKTTDYSSIPSPHSLYLFLLYTLGIIGLFTYLIYFGAIYTKLIKSKDIICKDPFLNGLPRLGIIILTVFVIDQIKLEFLRHTLHDYQHYIFMIFAAFVAFSDLLKRKNKIA